MARSVACLHAHHGNIAYLDTALAQFAVDVAHFVDPALVRRIADDSGFSEAAAGERVREQLRWMAEGGAGGIIVTCTAYVAAMPNLPIAGVDVPVLAIDEPFFAAVCRAPGPQAIVFTNPGTVDGTMRRLTAYAAAHGAMIEPRVELIAGAFDLFMSGRQAEHDAFLAGRLATVAGNASDGSVFAAQLSMTTAARMAEAAGSGAIANPLDALSAAVAGRLGLSPRTTVS